MRLSLLACALVLAAPVHAAEDYRVMKLEQDVRMLERAVQTLQRTVSELQRRTSRSDPTYTIDDDRQAIASEGELAWLKTAAWNRVRPGMAELEVIEILGKPTALRADTRERRTLLYTLEIGTAAFLTGSVAFDNGKVIEIQPPTLR